MDAPLRLLLVATPADAARAVEPVRRQGPVEAALAPTLAVLTAALRDAAWDAILVVPGSPVSDADVARAVAGQPAPLFAVSSEGVPAGLTSVAAFAMPFDALDALPFVLASLATDVPAASPATDISAASLATDVPAASSATDVSAAAPAAMPVAPPAAAPGVAFVAAANAALAETAHAATALASDFSDLLPGLPVSPAGVFVSAANATLAESARATAALPDALAAASHLPPAPDAPPPAPTPAAPTPAPAPPAPAAAASAVMTREAETLAQSLPIGVYRSSPDGRILYANPALADVLGVDLDALRRLDVRADLGYPREAFSEIMRRDGAVRNHTVGWTNPRGEPVFTRESARAVADASGRLVCYEGTMEDVTAEMAAREGERLRARHHAAVVHFAEAADAAASAEALAQAAVAALLAATQPDWALMLLHDGGTTLAAWGGRFPDAAAADLSADPAFGRVLVPDAPMLVRDTAAELPPWLPPSVGDVMRAHRMRSLGVFPVHRAGRPLGALVAGYDAPHAFSASERQAAEGLAWHLAGHLARHRAEQDLRDADASLRFIAARSAQTLYRLRYTPDGPGVRFDYLSPAVEALTGYDPAALAAAGGFDALVEARDVYAGEGLAHRAVAGATHYHAAYRIRTRAGETRWVENHAYPWHDADGAPLGLVGAFQDITERKHHDDRLADAAQQALARQSALVELARTDDAADHAGRTAELACETAGVDGASVWLLDGDRTTCRAASGCAAVGRPAAGPDEPLPAVLMAAADGARVLAIADVAADARLDAARAFFDARGTRAVLAAPVRRGPDAVGMLVLHRATADEPWTEAEVEYAAALADAAALAVERGERAAAERALRRSEARYRALADLTSDYAFAVRRRADGTRDVAWATDAFERLTGLAPHAVLAADGLRRLLHPDSLADVRAAFGALADGGEATVEARVVARDGQDRWLRHRARVGERLPDGAVMVYHSGEDVTERKRFEAELVAARELAEASRAEAETMVRLKSAFLANMSHEIRTPLTGILGYAEMLADEVADEQRPYVASIATSGQRLLDTLNSVLDLAQLEADGVCPDLRPTDVAAEARHAVDALRVLATRRGLALDVATDGPAWAALDSACLGRILTNLVGNALKFTDAGHVRVVVDTAAGVLPGPDGLADRLAVRIRVRDTGIGIPDAFLPHLFDEFRQETDGPSRSHEGSGLGLSITRRLTHLLGGHLSVESRRPGGSTFTVVFPALAPDAVPADAAPDAGRVLAAGTAVAAAAGAAVAALPPPVSADPTPAPVLRPPSPAAPDRVPGPPSQTSMFDFRFTSPRASAAPPDPSPEPEDATVEWTSAPPPVAEASPAAAVDAAVPAASAPAAPAPSGPRPAWPVDPAADRTPVMIVRPALSEPPPAELPAEPPAGPPTEQPPAATPPDALTDAGDARLPILVVEDNLDTRVLLDRILRGTYAVTAVGDARSALTAMAATRFRALVLDINLGGKETGTDILRVARSLDGYGDVFAVALTAYALPGDRERLLESGFDGYISKPFTRQSLMDVLSEGIRQ